jgi:flagellar assembly protein FliH
MNAPAAGSRPPTVSGLVDLQAEAYKEAFAQGLAEGREAGRGEVRTQVERLSAMLHDLTKPFEQLDADVERELLALAMALARQIVRRELKTDPTQIIGIIRDAIAALPVAAREVRVQLHPEDAAMARGGCQITSTNSRIDARLETRLNTIVSELMGAERHTDVPRGGNST